MKPPPFTYHRPDSLDEALALLAQHGDEAKVLAGGQSLVPLMALRMGQPAHVVDIGGIAGLDTIAADARASPASWVGARSSPAPIDASNATPSGARPRAIGYT